MSTSGVTTTPAPVWSPLVTNANADVYPSFAWTVPEYAAAGSRIWLQIEVNMGDSTTDTDDDTTTDTDDDTITPVDTADDSTTPPSSYYGVFQVTVKATAPTTPPPPPADDAEVSSLLTTIAIVTAVTAIGFLCFYLFII